jgi:hypothetical protein
MATVKPTFAKMGLKVNSDVKTIMIGDQEIEIKQYLPVNEKLILIGDVISGAADSNNFPNPVKLDVFTSLEIVFAYTNISFTDKQKEDIIKLYDILESNDVFNTIIAQIPKVEYKTIVDGVQECAKAYYGYRNSAYGIIESIAAQYDNLNMDVTALQQQLGNAENVEFLKEVLTKLG